MREQLRKSATKNTTSVPTQTALELKYCNVAGNRMPVNVVLIRKKCAKHQNAAMLWWNEPIPN